MSSEKKDKKKKETKQKIIIYTEIITQSHLPPKSKLHKQAITAKQCLNQKKILYLYI